MADLLEQYLDDLVGEARDLHLGLEQAAIDVGERAKLIGGIGIALFRLCPKVGEQLLHRHTDLPGWHPLEVVVEGILREQTGVLSEQAEHQPYAEHVQGVAALGRVGIDVLSAQKPVDLADQSTGVEGDLFLAGGAGPLRVDQEIEQVELLGQFIQPERDIVLPGLLSVEIVDTEMVEVGHDDRVGPL